MKTLVEAKHFHGPAENGEGGCYGRASEGGMCPGVRLTDWLNGLGDDTDRFANTTVGAVRRNWLRGSSHIREKSQEERTCARDDCHEVVSALQDVDEAGWAKVTVARNGVKETLHFCPEHGPVSQLADRLRARGRGVLGSGLV